MILLYSHAIDMETNRGAWRVLRASRMLWERGCYAPLPCNASAWIVPGTIGDE